MKSKTLPSFWKAYRALPNNATTAARKTFRLWLDSPFHPSLHFKCIEPEERVWSIRLTRNYRALGILEGDTVTWFWVGTLDDYERQF